eukprot:scaffold3443_cov404-Prasinococcus_capsulatus_cf.AAC.9
MGTADAPRPVGLWEDSDDEASQDAPGRSRATPTASNTSGDENTSKAPRNDEEVDFLASRVEGVALSDAETRSEHVSSEADPSGLLNADGQGPFDTAALSAEFMSFLSRGQRQVLDDIVRLRKEWDSIRGGQASARGSTTTTKLHTATPETPTSDPATVTPPSSEGSFVFTSSSTDLPTPRTRRRRKSHAHRRTACPNGTVPLENVFLAREFSWDHYGSRTPDGGAEVGCEIPGEGGSSGEASFAKTFPEPSEAPVTCSLPNPPAMVFSSMPHPDSPRNSCGTGLVRRRRGATSSRSRSRQGAKGRPGSHPSPREPVESHAFEPMEAEMGSPAAPRPDSAPAPFMFGAFQGDHRLGDQADQMRQAARSTSVSAPQASFYAHDSAATPTFVFTARTNGLGNAPSSGPGGKSEPTSSVPQDHSDREHHATARGAGHSRPLSDRKKQLGRHKAKKPLNRVNGAFASGLAFSVGKEIPLKEDFGSWADVYSSESGRAVENERESTIEPDVSEPVAPCSDSGASQPRAHRRYHAHRRVSSPRRGEWRIHKTRGDDIFKANSVDRVPDQYNGALSAYTEAIQSATSTPSDASQRDVAVLHANRAACKLMLQDYMAAFADCTIAISMDSGYLRAFLRGATCCMKMGRYSAAKQLYAQALGNGLIDQKLFDEGVEEMNEVRAKVVTLFDDYNRLKLLQGFSKDGSAFSQLLQASDQVLESSPGLPSVLRLRAEVFAGSGMSAKALELAQRCVKFTYPGKEAWFHELRARCYLVQGDLDSATRELREAMQYPPDKPVISDLDPSDAQTQSLGISSPEDRRKVLEAIQTVSRHKTRGNNAFMKGDYSEAGKEYTFALEISLAGFNICGSRIRAICLCNRAATCQKLGRMADAWADCSQAIALDGGFAKALSRRAHILSYLRLHEHAKQDLESLLELEPSSAEKVEIHTRLRAARREALAENQPLHYELLGLNMTATSAQIKKAYHSMALKHHPDKAFHRLPCPADSVDEVRQVLVGEAGRLFRAIGNAYGCLSDREKRLAYDQEEATRKATHSQSSRFADGSGGRRASQSYDRRRYSYRSPSSGSAYDYGYNGSSHRAYDRNAGFKAGASRWDGYSHRNRTWWNGWSEE